MDCPECGEELTTPDPGECWLTCSHCGGRTPNPSALDLRKRDQRPITPWGVAGTLLSAGGMFGLIVGTFGAAFADTSPNPLTSGRVQTVFLGFVTAMVLGFVLLHIDALCSRAAGVLTGRMLVLAVLALLAGLGGFVFAGSVCLSGGWR